MSKGLLISLFGHAAIVGMTAYNGLVLEPDNTASLPPHDAIGDLIRMADDTIPAFTKRLVIGNKTAVPIGAHEFCARRADLCYLGVQGEFLQAGKVFSKDELADINQTVNAMYTPSFDIDTFGQDEFWYIPDADGEPEMGGLADCEDYMLAKRKILIEGGWPAQDLYMAVVREKTQEQGGHAILIARVPGTDDYFGLDNLSETLLSLEQINDLYSMHFVSAGAMNNWRVATLELQPPA